MKAVILAGGLGSRLRPLSLKRPKPMLPLFGEPLLAHTLRRLESAGVDEAFLAIKYLPEQISDYFAAYKGMKLHFQVEREALGTAGCVRACAAQLRNEDAFLVVSGDAVWNLDLAQALEKHRERRPQATLLLYSSSEPLEYGLVRLGSDSRIIAFSEKPAWSRVYTDLVNTGIYILSPEILDSIPEQGPYDFAKDLFPALLSRGALLLGHEARGYWRDVGNCSAYHQCSMDALAGRIPFLRPDVRCQLPAGVIVRNPVFIGADVQAEPGAVLGPYAVLTAGTQVGAGAQVRNSVVSAASIGAGAELSGAVVLGGNIGERAALHPGSVVSDAARVERGATIQENVRVFPGQTVPAGFLLRGDLISTPPLPTPAFDSGVLRTGLDLSMALRLGRAAAFSPQIGAAWDAGAELPAQAFLCGARDAGAEASVLDAGFAAAAAFAARLYGLPLVAWFSGAGGPALRFFDGDGLPISRETERKLELGPDEAPQRRPGGQWHKSGVMDAYIAAACRTALGPIPLSVAVGGTGLLSRVLKQVLHQSGCLLREPAPGLLYLSVSDEGFSLRARDESGRPISPARLSALLAALELEHLGRAAVADEAPAFLDTLAGRLSARLLRPARDGAAAKSLYIHSPFLRDGVFAAVRLLSHLAMSRRSLSAALAAVPDFAQLHREIPLRRGRAEVMGRLTRSWAEAALDLSCGFQVCQDGKSARVSPLSEKRALRLEVEGENMEAAEEFMDALDKRIRTLDEQ